MYIYLHRLLYSFIRSAHLPTTGYRPILGFFQIFKHLLYIHKSPPDHLQQYNYFKYCGRNVNTSCTYVFSISNGKLMFATSYQIFLRSFFNPETTQNKLIYVTVFREIHFTVWRRPPFLNQAHHAILFYIHWQSWVCLHILKLCCIVKIRHSLPLRPMRPTIY